MGFIQALCDLGKEAVSADAAGDEQVQWPMQLVEDVAKQGRELRVWLDVADVNAASLEVLGVAKLDEVAYPHEEKGAYLYREPNGAAATWQYAPIAKLGPGGKNLVKLYGQGSEAAVNELKQWLCGESEKISVSEIEEIKKIKASRLYKLKHAMLESLEREGVLAPGAVACIFQGVLARVEELADLWNDKKRSYMLVFGVRQDNQFLYPKEVPAFRAFFQKKLGERMQAKKENSLAQKHCCAVCGQEAGQVISIDKLFAFATFDKASFLPGAQDYSGAKDKVYPLCLSCYQQAFAGRQVVKERFRDIKTIPKNGKLSGVTLDIIPEFVFGEGTLRKKIEGNVQAFLKQGLVTEERSFRRLVKQGDSLVYHFLFWEQNNKQERIHFLLEDVPPSRLRRILTLWQSVCQRHLPLKEEETQTRDLDHLFRLLYHCLMSLVGEERKDTKEDKKILRERLLCLVGKLLGGEPLDAYWFKQLVVSRLPGLCADSEWVRRQGMQDVRQWQALVAFLEEYEAG